MLKTNSPLIDSAALLAAATGVLYCASTAFTHGYMRSLLLDSDVLDRNFHQVLYDGFIQIFPRLYMPIAAAIFLQLLLAYFVPPDFFSWFKKELVGKTKHSRSQLSNQAKFWRLVRYYLYFFIFIATLAWLEGKGQSHAEEKLSIIKGSKLADKNQMIKAKIGETEKSLLALYCGARNCAGADLTTGVIHYFPQNGHSFQVVIPTPTISITVPATSTATVQSANRAP